MSILSCVITDELAVFTSYNQLVNSALLHQAKCNPISCRKDFVRLTSFDVLSGIRVDLIDIRQAITRGKGPFLPRLQQQCGILQFELAASDILRVNCNS